MALTADLCHVSQRQATPGPGTGILVLAASAVGAEVRTLVLEGKSGSNPRPH